MRRIIIYLIVGFLVWIVVASIRRMLRSTQSNQSPQETPPTIKDVEWLAAQGKTTEAIRAYRILTGAGLQEASDAVRAMQQSALGSENQPGGANSNQALAKAAEDVDVLLFIDARRNIEAIKRVRELTGVGLSEAKEFVERLSLERSRQS